MILVTGAGGKTGFAVLRALQKQPVPTRAWVRHAHQINSAKQAGATDVVMGDMLSPEVWQMALAGVNSIYLVCPNMHPQEVEMGQLLVANAPSSLQHIVYHSVLHPQTEKMPHHWAKMRVEELLLESGIPTTILQPTAYMQNIVGSWHTITQTGKFRVPYPVSTKISLVDLGDVAKVGAMVLTDERHKYATYELVGTSPLSQTDVANQLTKQLGFPIVAEEMSLVEWQKQTMLSGYGLDTILKMFDYYGKCGFAGNSHTLSTLLQRLPTTLNTFLHNVLKYKKRGAT